MKGFVHKEHAIYVYIFFQKLSDKEHECNAAQKKKEEAVHQKEKIEEDYLR